MKESVYIETTVISYLASRPSRDIVSAAWQEMTRLWWTERRTSFEIFISERVIFEASSGDESAAQKRLDYLQGITVLKLTDDAVKLADDLFKTLQLPEKAVEDAFHIAIAITSGIDYLLTWNCKHIANAMMIHKIEKIANSNGYIAPVICTPQELMEDYK